VSYSAHANKKKKKKKFQPGDLVSIHLQQEHKNKLMPRADGPFEILECMNNNAYKVDLPGDYGVSAAFNVADLSLYEEDEYLYDLRSNHVKQGEDDGNQSDISQSRSSSQGSPSTNV